MTSHDAPGAAPAPAPGTVAEEAALLVDLLSQRGWGGSSRTPSGSSSADDHSAGTAGSAGDRTNGQADGNAHDGAHDHAHGAASDGPSSRASGAGGPDGSRSECTCGGTTPAACRVCPVCQLIAFVQQVNPDTIDRVADFVGFAATALRDLATAQRERRPDTDEGENDTSRPGGHG